MSAAIRIKGVLLGCFLLIPTTILLWFAACSKPSPPQAPAKTPEAITVDSHGLHSVKGEELRSIMRRLKEMKFDEVAEEIQLTGDLQRDVCEVADMAVLLARDAQVIPLIFDDPEMSPESRRTFATLSAKFRLQALELSAAADNRDVRKVGAKLEDLINTCNECHVAAGNPRLASVVPGFPFDRCYP